TKTNQVCVTLSENSQNIKYLHKFLEDESVRKEGACRIIKGEETMKLIFHEIELDKFEKLVGKQTIESVETGLSEIDIYLGKEAWGCKGLVARIANEIANHDVNISEVISVLPELLFFVKSKDLINAHQAVFSLVSGKKAA
ncbi:MAG: hypothetical protein KKG59_05655, partial [Nanoarchaeota archaeon]|nr:hypothetical protein [Nanoarchaeota archaeon]